MLTPSLYVTNPRTLNLFKGVFQTFFPFSLKIKCSVVKQNSESNTNQIALISEKWRDRNGDFRNSLESDHDDIPLDQRMKKLHKPSPQPQQTTSQLPLQAEQSSAAAEGTEDPEDPPTSDLPQCDSPSNLFSLERHLGW